MYVSLGPSMSQHIGGCSLTAGLEFFNTCMTWGGGGGGGGGGNSNFLKENFCILIKITLKFVPEDPIDNEPALILVMAWHKTGHNPLPEPMLTKIIDAIWCHYR